MAYALILVGIVLTVAGVRNTQGALYSYLYGDFTGANNFWAWTIAIVVIGSVGFIPDARKLSNAFLLLIVIVLLIAQNQQGGSVFGTWLQFAQGKLSIPAAPVAATATASAPGSEFTSGGFDPVKIGGDLADWSKQILGF